MSRKNDEVSNLEIFNTINELRKELVLRDELLEEKVDRTYLRIKVFESEVEPLKKFVYGLISIAGGALLLALLGLVIK